MPERLAKFAPAGMEGENYVSHSKLTALCRAVILSAVVMMLSAEPPALAQQQPQPNPAVQQFGPRLKQPAQQQQQRRGKPPEVVATHGDWVLQCEDEPEEKVAGATPDKPHERACGMVQTARNEERKNIALTLVLMLTEQQGKQATMMRVMAPIGVFLPTGVALEIDGAAVGRVPFTRCLPQVCIAFAEASPQTLEKLKKGDKANFIIYEAPGLGINLKLSLKGFTAGLDALGKL